MLYVYIHNSVININMWYKSTKNNESNIRPDMLTLTHAWRKGLIVLQNWKYGVFDMDRTRKLQFKVTKKIDGQKVLWWVHKN